MKIIKFGINENSYDKFKAICTKEGLTIKKKINNLMTEDTIFDHEINMYFPEIPGEGLRTITLKINEELYDSLKSKANILDIRTRKYINYLIYKCVKEQ
jgi:hypothetical protein